MGTRVSYPAEVKLEDVKLRLEGTPVKAVMEQLNIRNTKDLDEMV
jgi:transposase